MLQFYQNLAKGLTKDEALRLARQEYIAKSDNRFAHPFFWAAAVPMGNMAPVDVQLRNANMYWFLGLGLIILTFMLYFYTKYRKKQTI